MSTCRVECATLFLVILFELPLTEIATYSLCVIIIVVLNLKHGLRKSLNITEFCKI